MEAESRKDTTMQWDLIAAATEDANIQYHNLQGRDATKMKGRSKLKFKKKTRDSLEGIEADDGNLEQVSKAKWWRQVAAAHTKMGNKLTNVARRMKTKHKGQGGELTKDKNKDLIQRTFKAYCQMATKQSSKHQLSDQQKKQIGLQWMIAKGSKGSASRTAQRSKPRKQKHTYKKSSR